MQISTIFLCENIEIQWNKLWWNCSFVARNISILTKFRRRKRSTEAWGMERSLWLAACCEIFNPWIGNGTRCSHWAAWHPDSNVLRRFARILFWNVLNFLYSISSSEWSYRVTAPLIANMSSVHAVWQVCLTELVHAVNLDVLWDFDARDVSGSVQNTLRNG